ncbi:MAG: hypothetical protein V5804_11655 [Mucilaginibacter sp.]|uniref:hypothetical protein n=1 Tax=Mucilaginibacter sp. TaxID=1882438 RepID=UPI0034E4FC0B
MKTLFSVLFVLMAFKSYSQSLYKLPEQPKAKYSAQDSIVADQINQSINLYGKVEFEINGLNVKADQVFYDQKNHQVLAKGLNSYTFDKKVSVVKGSKNRTLKYTVGGDTVFIE